MTVFEDEKIDVMLGTSSSYIRKQTFYALLKDHLNVKVALIWQIFLLS